jgi:oligosaccharide repeat unit polymerase
MNNRGSELHSVVWLQAAVLLAALVMAFSPWSDCQFSAALTKPLCIFFALHLAWVFWSWNAVTGRWLDAYTMFFLSLCLFNGGQFLLEAVGLNRNGILGEAFAVETTNRTILLVNAAVAAYHFGGVVRCLRGRSLGSYTRDSRGHSSGTSFLARRASAIGLFFLAVSTPAVLFNLKTAVENAAANGYMALFQRESLVGTDNWRAVLGAFFVPGILITLAMFRKSQLEVAICWALTVIYTAVNLFIGTRSTALMACVPVAMLHHALVRRINPLYLMIGGLTLLSLLPLIAMTRNQAAANRGGFVETVLIDNPLVSAVSEMGNSANTTAHTLELMPSERKFDCGLGYGYALLTAIPNLFWDLHPSVQWGKYGDWLVWTVSPDTARIGGGLGYSVLAEAYANFSIFGPPLVGALLGFSIAALVGWARSMRSPFPIALEMIALSAILILARSETAVVVRPLIWTCVIPYFFVRYRPGSIKNPARMASDWSLVNRHSCHEKGHP